MLRSRKDRHIKLFSDIDTAKSGHPFTSKRSAIPINRGQTDEGGDFASVQRAEFGEFADEHTDGLGADPGSGAENFGFPPQVVTLLSKGTDPFIDYPDFLFEGIDNRTNALSDDFDISMFGAADFGSTNSIQLFSSCAKILYFRRYLIESILSFRFDSGRQ